MRTEWTRRNFLWTGTALGLSGLAAGALGAEREPGAPSPGIEPAVPVHFPQQAPALVAETVGVSHGNLERVRELVGARPALARAAWDWGYGDWETALGAASHTGNREIARYLIDHGARPTLFSAAMLGQLAVVRAFVEASPGVQRIRGPHGITLLAHARAGGEPAQGVLDYLEALGDADPAVPAPPLSEQERRKYHGRYVFGPTASDALIVAENKFGMTITRGDGTPRLLTHVGEHAFHPAGAEAVRIRFRVVEERARELAVYDPELLLRARRVDG
jgi:hypothetical protein